MALEMNENGLERGANCMISLSELSSPISSSWHINQQLNLASFRYFCLKRKLSEESEDAVHKKIVSKEISTVLQPAKTAFLNDYSSPELVPSKQTEEKEHLFYNEYKSTVLRSANTSFLNDEISPKPVNRRQTTTSVNYQFQTGVWSSFYQDRLHELEPSRPNKERENSNLKGSRRPISLLRNFVIDSEPLGRRQSGENENAVQKKKERNDDFDLEFLGRRESWEIEDAFHKKMGKKNISTAVRPANPYLFKRDDSPELEPSRPNKERENSELIGSRRPISLLRNFVIDSEPLGRRQSGENENAVQKKKESKDDFDLEFLGRRQSWESEDAFHKKMEKKKVSTAVQTTNPYLFKRDISPELPFRTPSEKRKEVLHKFIRSGSRFRSLFRNDTIDTELPFRTPSEKRKEVLHKFIKRGSRFRSFRNDTIDTELPFRTPSEKRKEALHWFKKRGSRFRSLFRNDTIDTEPLRRRLSKETKDALHKQIERGVPSLLLVNANTSERKVYNRQLLESIRQIEERRNSELNGWRYLSPSFLNADIDPVRPKRQLRQSEKSEEAVHNEIKRGAPSSLLRPAPFPNRNVYNRPTLKSSTQIEERRNSEWNGMDLKESQTARNVRFGNHLERKQSNLNKLQKHESKMYLSEHEQLKEETPGIEVYDFFTSP